jgi:hypothetical protein
METIMNIHTHAIQATTLCDAGETRRLTMRWQVRDGVLGQVWRTADGTAATRDAGETQHLAA